MRGWLLIGGVILAAGCDASSMPDGPAAGDPGTYTRRLPDGALNQTVIRPDGSYLTTIDGAPAAGKVRVSGSTTCFLQETDGAEETCWTNGPIRPGGTFEATDSSGQTVTVTYSADLPVKMQPGLYEVGDETTAYGRSRLRADGTYTDHDGENEIGRGTWASTGHLICFDPEGDGEDQQVRCWINGPAEADGSFMTTRDDGSQSYRVTRIGS